MVRGVFRLLRDHPDGLAAKDVLQQLRAEVPPTAFEASEYPDRPGVVRYDKLVRFATIPAVKAGWMGKAKGIWSITEEGTSAYDAFPDSEQFMKQAVIASTDPLGIVDPRIKVQVKRRGDKVRVDDLRSFLAVLGERDVGIFVNVGGFTSDAEIEARTQESRKITLIDLERLFDLWVEHYPKIAQEKKLLLPLRQVHFLAPEG